MSGVLQGLKSTALGMRHPLIIHSHTDDQNALLSGAPGFDAIKP